MLYQIENGKIQTNAVEYSVAYHCNLKCSSCSHMSPFIDTKLPPLESFERDVNRLSEVLHAKDIRLLGGEPLLNPDIVGFLKAARQSGIADRIMLTTNGLLLHSMKDEFWENVDFIWLSLYPGVSPKEKLVAKFVEKAKASNTKFDIDVTTHFRTTVTTQAQPKDWTTDMIFKTCRSAHLFHCHMIHEGSLYKCACPPFMPEYLGRVGIDYSAEADGFFFHDRENLLEDLKDFLFTRRTLDACQYCLGYVGKWQDQRQLTKTEFADPKTIVVSRETDLNRRKLIQETVKYYGRRVKERLSGQPQW